MDKQVKVYGAAILAFVLVMVVWHFQADKYNVSKPYRDDDYGFSILYPKSWEVVTKFPDDVEESEAMVAVFRSPVQDAFQESTLVWAYPREDDIKEDELLEFFLEDVAEVGRNFEMLERDLITIEGRKAERGLYRVHLTLSGDRGIFAQFLTYAILGDSHLFIVQCTSPVIDFDKHFETFEKICQSFSLDGSP